MQPVSTLGPAFSPVQKQRFDVSGYPSPPSSGRTEHQDGNQGCLENKVDVVEVAKIIEVQISQRQERVHSLSPPTSNCKLDRDDDEEDEDEFDNESDQEGDETIVAIDRSRSSTSWSDSQAQSSPSTSIATQSQAGYHHLQQQIDPRGGSPYVGEELPMAPIRDTPGNCFLMGGPADVGHSGPNKGSKKVYSRPLRRERGKMTYVFRGQRVTYADPYSSDSEDENNDGSSSSGGSLMDRLQPKLLFRNIGKATSRSNSAGRDCFGVVKKSDVIPVASKPTLEMVAQRQPAGLKSAKNTNSHPLIEKINKAGWSDEEDDEVHHHRQDDQKDVNDEEIDVDVQEEHQGRHFIDDDDYDDDMVVEDDNPFLMEPSCNQASASFLHRLQQAQVIAASTLRSRSTVVRHRFNPYNQNRKQSETTTQVHQ